MEIIDKISLRPAVVEKDQDEIYLFLSDRNEIILHDCNSDECLLSPTMRSVPLWVGTAQGPNSSLTAWMYDEHTPESCRIAGLSQDSVNRVFKDIERGILIVKYLTDIRAIGQISRLVLDSDVTYIDTTRVRIVTSVWKDIKQNLTYDAALAKERVDKHRKARMEQIDKDLAYYRTAINKCLEEKKQLQEACEKVEGFNED